MTIWNFGEEHLRPSRLNANFAFSYLQAMKNAQAASRSSDISNGWFSDGDTKSNLLQSNSTAMVKNIGTVNIYMGKEFDYVIDSSLDTSIWTSSGKESISGSGNTRYINYAHGNETTATELIANGASAIDCNQKMELVIVATMSVRATTLGTATNYARLKIRDQSSNEVTIKQISSTGSGGTVTSGNMHRIVIDPSSNNLYYFEDDTGTASTVSISSLTDGDVWDIMFELDTHVGSGSDNYGVAQIYGITYAEDGGSATDVYARTSNLATGLSSPYSAFVEYSETSPVGTPTIEFSFDGTNYQSFTEYEVTTIVNTGTVLRMSAEAAVPTTITAGSTSKNIVTLSAMSGYVLFD